MIYKLHSTFKFLLITLFDEFLTLFLTFKVRVGNTPLTDVGQTKSGNPLCGKQSKFKTFKAITVFT